MGAELLLSLRDLDAPPARSGHLAAEYLELWARHVGPVRHRATADPEDFWEQAARLHAAVSAFGADGVWLSTYDGHRAPGPARNLGSGQVRALGELQHLMPYGSQFAVDARHGGDLGMPASEVAAGDYMRDVAFTANAGRPVVLCALEAPGSPDLWDVIAGMAAGGDQKVVVKTALTKGGLWVLDVPAGASPEQVRRLDDADDLGWDTVRREGDRDAYLVQQWVAMRFEYRVFVVEHEVVTAAGCVEEFTPLENASAFDLKVRRRRAEQDPVAERADVVEVLHRFACSVADQTRHERPEVADYVLDVALGADGQPLVVERNGLLNSGLYASDPIAVVTAMAARCSRARDVVTTEG